jgi:hypothetical protein
MSSSEYFSALFNSEMIETKTKEISLKETLIKPFIIVLKLSYGLIIAEEEWLEIKIQELFESIITANKYQFIECEKLLSQKMIDIFSFKISDFDEESDQLINKSNDNSLLTIWELLEMAKLHNLMFLIDLCLIFFDENISYAFKTFDKQFISADILLDVISRDTFGAKEIDIFKIVEKWIHKHRIRYNLKCIEEKLLLESVRLTLMSLEELNSIVVKSGLYESEFIDHLMKHEMTGDLAQNNRICYESGKLFSAYSSTETYLRNEEKVTVCVTCLLPMPTKINHIMFRIRPLFCGESQNQFNANYWIGVPDSSAENGFRKVIDYKQYSCNGEQDLYFETPFVTNSIRICLESNREVIETNETPNLRLFSDRKQFTINSLGYEFSKNPLKLIDSCIVPETNISTKYGVDCYSPFFGDQYNQYLNEIVLNQSDFHPNPRHYSLRSHELRSHLPAAKEFKNLIQVPIRDFDEQSPPYYIIRLAQPIYVDSLQFEILLENKIFRYDEIPTAECKVEFCSEYGRDLSSADWKTISEDSYIRLSGFYNLEFDLQKVLVIRITGFRSNSDRSVRYPLNIKNFSIPANRSSPEWSHGFNLGIN